MNEFAVAVIALRIALGAHALVPAHEPSPSGRGQGESVSVANAAPSPKPTPKEKGSLSALHVYPDNISLTSARDSQTVVVQAEYADGITRDVTDKATWKLDHEDRVTRNANRFLPRADGDAKLTAAFKSAHFDVPISVKHATFDPPISFKLDVMPVFMRAGCNVGSCHGSARGKDGFRLSLFGFDPDGDYYRLTHEQPKRRLDLSIPAECLLIEKATGQVPHTGGSPTKKGDPLYNTLLRWLEAARRPTPAGSPLSMRSKSIRLARYSKPATPSSSPFAPSIPTAPTATSPASPSSSRATTAPPPLPRRAWSPPPTAARPS